MGMGPSKLLWILEDDQGARFVYDEILGFRYQLRFFEDLSALRNGLSGKADIRPHLLIADLRLPGQSFLQFLALPETNGLLTFPFIVVSSVDDLDALRCCFAHGAIDYLTKPFGKGALVVKVERALSGETPYVRVSDPTPGDINIDPSLLKVSRNGIQSLTLTSKEYQILVTLEQAQNKTVSREEMIGRIWSSVHVTPKTLDVHLYNLRRKISPLGLEIMFRAPNLYRLSSDGVDK